MNAATQLRTEVGAVQACDALGIARATFYRKLKPPRTEANRPAPQLALSDQERQTVIELLHSERFQDDAPRQVFACLLDEGTYHCSVRTMYRILKDEHGAVKERRRQVQRPVYEKPELLATGADEVWSWDITKLLGPVKRLVTPEEFHYGLAPDIVDHRQRALKAAFKANPSRFKGKIPKPPALPTAAWINRPSSDVVRV